MNEEGPLAFFSNMFFYKGTVLPAILPQIILATTVAAAVYVGWRYQLFKGFSTVGHSALGGLVSTLLVFRNNLSHARCGQSPMLCSAGTRACQWQPCSASCKEGRAISVPLHTHGSLLVAPCPLLSSWEPKPSKVSSCFGVTLAGTMKPATLLPS
jgi:hypothetical protein